MKQEFRQMGRRRDFICYRYRRFNRLELIESEYECWMSIYLVYIVLHETLYMDIFREKMEESLDYKCSKNMYLRHRCATCSRNPDLVILSLQKVNPDIRKISYFFSKCNVDLVWGKYHRIWCLGNLIFYIAKK